jgi:hypothetical protein
MVTVSVFSPFDSCDDCPAAALRFNAVIGCMVCDFITSAVEARNRLKLTVQSPRLLPFNESYICLLFATIWN